MKNNLEFHILCTSGRPNNILNEKLSTLRRIKFGLAE